MNGIRMIHYDYENKKVFFKITLYLLWFLKTNYNIIIFT